MYTIILYFYALLRGGSASSAAASAFGTTTTASALITVFGLGKRHGLPFVRVFAARRFHDTNLTVRHVYNLAALVGNGKLHVGVRATPEFLVWLSAIP